MSLVYLSGSEENNVNVANCKQELINAGHSVIVMNKFNWDILCRCDYLVVEEYGINTQEYEYAFMNNIPIYKYYDIPKMPTFETTMPTLVKIFREDKMNEYRKSMSNYLNGDSRITCANIPEAGTQFWKPKVDDIIEEEIVL